MACPVLWWKTPLFYPIGNTPPICLTRDLAPEEKAQILLLGCGDPRSILFTIYHDLAAERSIDITCCDLQPAILARNMLLLSMFADGIPPVHSWPIFYHFFLDDESIKVLFNQCATLIRASATLAAWNSSVYGNYLQFCTEESMVEIRRHWELYFAIKDLTKAKKEALRESFSFEMKKACQDKHADISTIRAVVPLFSEKCLQLGLSIFKTYWTTGVLNGRSSQILSAPHANPLFAYSLAGSKFNTLRVNPISNFHLSPSLANFKDIPSSASELAIEDFIETAKHQFSIWCTSFRARVNAQPSSVVIRFFSGDCIALSKAMRKCHEEKTTTTKIHTRQWGISRITFTDNYDETSPAPAPLLFNVIDTSNLIDSLGLLNILLVTVPLLQRKPWSVLYTNSLVRCLAGEVVTSALHDRVLADIPTLSLLLGVSPTSEVFPFTTYNLKLEEMVAGGMHSLNGQFHQYISWRYPSSIVAHSVLPSSELGDEPEVLQCDESQLAGFLFSIYTQMFVDETFPDGNPASIWRRIDIQYIRASFVELLSFVRQRVHVDWGQTMDRLLRLVEADTTLVFGSNTYQDLICQLYLSEVFTLDTLRWDFLRRERTADDIFKGWKDVPPVVSVILKVPRSRLKVLEDVVCAETGNPILLCDTMGLRGENIHSAVRPTFGEVVLSGNHGEAQATINEDPAGWEGDSALLVSFDVPSWLFTERARVNAIGVRLRPTPQSMKLFMSKLGDVRMRFFSTTPTDKAHVYITRRRPNDSQEICHPEDNDVMANCTAFDDQERMIKVDFDTSGPSPRVTSLTVRRNVADPDAAKKLARGASVSVKAVSQTTILASFEGHDQVFRFPFPIRGDATKTKIARRSSYIEIVGSVQNDMNILPVKSNLFPISRTGTFFNILHVPYIKLTSMPAFRLPIPPDKRKSLTSLLSWTFPDKRQKIPQSETLDIAEDIKKRTSLLILESFESSAKVFGISTFDHNPGLYLLVFLNELRLDLSSRSVVIDACVIPLTKSNIPKVTAAIQQNLEGLHQIHSENDGRAWKAVLPIFAERCRTWKHKDGCEYRTRGIPACEEGGWNFVASPLCSCGLGQDLGAFAKLSEWKTIHSEATRVAISPFFPSSLIGEVPKGPSVSQAAAPGSARTPTADACARCGGPGRPSLLVCSRCKQIRYCSQECQKAHWKSHKPLCTK